MTPCELTNVPLRKLYLERLLANSLTVIAFNGFQLKGTLIAFDNSAMLIETNQYGGSKNTFVCNFAAIVPEYPVSGTHLSKYIFIADDGKNSTLKREYLSELHLKSVTVIAANGFRLNGRLIAYDNTDLVIETTQYGNVTKDVLVCNYVTVVPGE